MLSKKKLKVIKPCNYKEQPNYFTNFTDSYYETQSEETLESDKKQPIQ